MKAPFTWDYNSDQPYQLKDRNFKKAMRKKEKFSLIKTVLYALFILPLSWLFIPFTPKRNIDTSKFFAMGITLSKDVESQVALIKELDIKNILIRIPLWDIAYIKNYVRFVQAFSEVSITINIMQDREHIEDKTLLAKSLYTIFSHLHKEVEYFQIGTTINRAKWGFFSVDEYIEFYTVAQAVRYNFEDIKLIGPSVIDFEYHYTAHALFSQKHFNFDGISALLYVDRRGAPESKQMGFNLLSKIRLLSSMMNLSQKSAQKLFITETNWPLSNTAPFAPTSEHECVSEEAYAEFMLRYYLISLGSKQVDVVFWHQLIANGYGLIDIREGFRKRLAFEYLKTLISLFSKVEVIRLKKSAYYTLTCKSLTHKVEALWSTETSINIENIESLRYLNALGEEINTPLVTISSKVVYRLEAL